MERILKIAQDYRLELVEDAAESLGSYYHGQHTGTFGRLGTLSFNGNKTITTGGGGAILTQDPELARHAKHLTTTAKLPHRWDYVHDEVGFNYRMPNLNAALQDALNWSSFPTSWLPNEPCFSNISRRFRRFGDRVSPGTTRMPEQLLAADPEAFRLGCQ